ncbi:hypothetical protein TRICI_000986 [Trichomonascus ciferrii]|uniref:Uncharacterized protein n=1 Tax=Trichomonascus ciferrii TaxID=44093 RepID=A0A642VB77_9ASCO|nr:hypothetical protein TRICI_000986 [Trichomonascus ciferrii]
MMKGETRIKNESMSGPPLLHPPPPIPPPPHMMPPYPYAQMGSGMPMPPPPPPVPVPPPPPHMVNHGPPPGLSGDSKPTEEEQDLLSLIKGRQKGQQKSIVPPPGLSKVTQSSPTPIRPTPVSGKVAPSTPSTPGNVTPVAGKATPVAATPTNTTPITGRSEQHTPTPVRQNATQQATPVPVKSEQENKPKNQLTSKASVDHSLGKVMSKKEGEAEANTKKLTKRQQKKLEQQQLRELSEDARKGGIPVLKGSLSRLHRESSQEDDSVSPTSEKTSPVLAKASPKPNKIEEPVREVSPEANSTQEKSSALDEERENRKKRVEDERKKKLEEVRERRRQAEEERRKKLEEERERKRQLEEEKKKRLEEERERKRKVEEEKKQRAEEGKKRKAEEERKRKAEEAERQRKAAEEEARRRKAAEEEKERKAVEEEKKRRKAVADEAKKRKAAEEEKKRKAAEEEKKRKAAEEEKKRKAAEEEKKRQTAEEEKSLKASGGKGEDEKQNTLLEHVIRGKEYRKVKEEGARLVKHFSEDLETFVAKNREILEYKAPTPANIQPMIDSNYTFLQTVEMNIDQIKALEYALKEVFKDPQEAKKLAEGLKKIESQKNALEHEIQRQEAFLKQADADNMAGESTPEISEPGTPVNEVDFDNIIRQLNKELKFKYFFEPNLDDPAPAPLTKAKEPLLEKPSESVKLSAPALPKQLNGTTSELTNALENTVTLDDAERLLAAAKSKSAQLASNVTDIWSDIEDMGKTKNWW